MTPRRPRRPDDNRFLLKDAKAWRALVRAARYQARAPLAQAGALDAAVARCAKACPPAGERRRDSDFLKLLGLARGFWRLAAPERQARAEELSALADRVQAVLDRPAPGPTPRADIFG